MPYNIQKDFLDPYNKVIEDLKNRPEETEMTNQQIAQELLQVLSNSQHHNPAWVLKETLEKLQELISGTNENVDWRDECNVSYVNGYDDCLKSIDDVCDELEEL